MLDTFILLGFCSTLVVVLGYLMVTEIIHLTKNYGEPGLLVIFAIFLSLFAYSSSVIFRGIQPEKDRRQSLSKWGVVKTARHGRVTFKDGRKCDYYGKGSKAYLVKNSCSKAKPIIPPPPMEPITKEFK